MRLFVVMIAVLFVSALAPAVYAQEETTQTAPGTTQPAVGASSTPSGGFEAAMRLYRQRRYSQAIEAFDAVLQSEPDNAAAYYFKGYAQYVTRQYPESVASFGQAFQKNPTFDPRPYFR